jgi:hypothetical protein
VQPLTHVHDWQQQRALWRKLWQPDGHCPR